MAIYHYTSIETLALILSSRRIRFNRLDLVDDLSEARVGDLEQYRYLFVSCWTRSEEESLPLWHMYTDQMCGVRLELAENPFRMFEAEGVLGGLSLPRGHYTTPIDPDTMFGDGFWIFPVVPSEFPKDVQYRDDENLLFPQATIDEPGQFTLNQHLVGEYKRTAWSFQDETRFRLQVYPTIGNICDLVLQGGRGSAEEITRRFTNPIRENVPPSIDHVDLEISEQSFVGVKILIGPRCSTAQHLIVESIVNRHCPTAEICTSALSGEIR